jgi:uncharacterized membrane protein (GlpM family)
MASSPKVQMTLEEASRILGGQSIESDSLYTIMTMTREITLNAISLACGFAGNLLLLFHFVGRVRYIVALPLSIVFWLLASGIVSDVP